MKEQVSSPQGEYSMRVATRMTGLPADTIRTWERRYSAVTPQRTPGGSRRYSAGDIRRLSLLRKATEQGHRIRDIAGHSESALQRLSAGELLRGERGMEAAQGERLSTRPFTRLREQFLEAIERFDARKAGDVLARASALFPTRDFIFKLLLPIMHETGERWEQGRFSIAHEHLVSMQVRSLLESLLRLSSPLEGAPKVLAATPAGHLHEFGALAGALLAASRGFDSVYLGTDIPEKDLSLAIDQSGAGLTLLSVVRTGPEEEIEALAASLERLNRKAPIWVGTPPEHPLSSFTNSVRVLHRYEDLEVGLIHIIQQSRH